MGKRRSGMYGGQEQKRRRDARLQRLHEKQQALIVQSTPNKTKTRQYTNINVSKRKLPTYVTASKVKGGLYEKIFSLDVDPKFYTDMASTSIRTKTMLRNLERSIGSAVGNTINFLIRRMGMSDNPNIGIIPVGGTRNMRKLSHEYLISQRQYNTAFNFELHLGIPVEYARSVNEKPDSRLQHKYGKGSYMPNKSGGYKRRKPGQGGYGKYRRVISYNGPKSAQWGYVDLNDVQAKHHFFEKLLSMGQRDISSQLSAIFNGFYNTNYAYLKSIGIDFNLRNWRIENITI